MRVLLVEGDVLLNHMHDQNVMHLYHFYLVFLFSEQVAGILRGCYTLGMLDGIDESRGCQDWTAQNGYRAHYCFCDTDYCNDSFSVSASSVAILCLVCSIGLILRPS